MAPIRWFVKKFICGLLGLHRYKVLCWIAVDDRYDPEQMLYTQKRCRYCGFSVIKNEFFRTTRRGKTQAR